MEEQNIYDSQDFFDGYKKLRENPFAANSVIEKPALFSLCPGFVGKTILDLGCGYGENCCDFSRLGASKVVGIDISAKMLEVATSNNDCKNVAYMQMSMNNLTALNEKFDIVVSSLAVHYIEDFDKMLASIYALLNDNGIFVFSQEHPLTTAPRHGPYWSRDEGGNITHYNLTDYSDLGQRSTTWIVDNVVKYHRSFSAIFNALTGAGFTIQKVLEPMPDEATMEQLPAYRKYWHKPDFLLVRAGKAG